jgi:diadenosine tetraphosphate (Ap4A) HIT family hydrolase
MSGFELHPRLAADTVPVGDLALCRLLVMRDARFAWAILVPRRAGVREVHELAPSDQALLIGEAALVAARIAGWPGITKINHGALGNLVPQLHWHVVGRAPGDAAWPGPVWGSGAAVEPEPGWLAALVSLLS